MSDQTCSPQHNAPHDAAKPQIALLFPGQGSQSVGMGRAFYDSVPAARAVFDEADEALGFPLVPDLGGPEVISMR